jgi:hypothetical protein
MTIAQIARLVGTSRVNALPMATEHDLPLAEARISSNFALSDAARSCWVFN